MPSGFRSVPGVPVDTFQAARKVFNIQHIYIRIGDSLDKLLADCDLGLLDPTASLSADVVFRHALVTAFQYAETLPDPMAADATLRRMDWKYALFLPVSYPGISVAALCSFREHLYSNQKGLSEYARLLRNLTKMGLFSKKAGNTTSPALALNTICLFTRFYYMKQTMKITLGVLTSTAPDWMRANALPHWYERYKTGGLQLPDSDSLANEADQLGADVSQLLQAMQREDPNPFNELAEVCVLARLFQEQYRQDGGAPVWRAIDCSACSARDLENFIR